MPNLNKDVLFLIFEELWEDSKSLFSCLMVNRIWCETVIPILWRNPWHFNIEYSKLFMIITFYLPHEILKKQEIEPPSVSCKSQLFDYLSYCRSINVEIINNIIYSETLNDQSILQEFCSLLIR